MSGDKLKEIERQALDLAALPRPERAPSILAALQQARDRGREEERKALREKFEGSFNPHADRLVLDCGRCEDEVPYDYTVTEEAWAVVPDQYRLGVLCLSCLDGITPGGLDPESILAVYATVYRGTVPLLPARRILAALDARSSQGIGKAPCGHS